MKWIKIEDQTHVAIVPGGIVMLYVHTAADDSSGASSICFIPCSDVDIHGWLALNVEGK